MPTQLTFDFAIGTPPPRNPPPIDPNADAADRPRLGGQNAAILALLESKPEVSNAELAGISLKYTGRISDLRAAGHAIKITRREGGTRFYSLIRNAG